MELDKISELIAYGSVIFLFVAPVVAYILVAILDKFFPFVIVKSPKATTENKVKS